MSDYFPNNLAYLGVTSLGGGTLVDAPTLGAAANPPDNDLIVNFASLTGSTDITVSSRSADISRISTWIHEAPTLARSRGASTPTSRWSSSKRQPCPSGRSSPI